jgi:hypothetical protein
MIFIRPHRAAALILRMYERFLPPDSARMISAARWLIPVIVSAHEAVMTDSGDREVRIGCGNSIGESSEGRPSCPSSLNNVALGYLAV